VFCRSLLVLLCVFFFWSLYCLSFFDWLLLSTPLTSSNFSFGHCIVCLSLIDYFWVLLWHLQTFLLVIVLYVFLWLTTSEYSFDIFKLFFWSLYCLSFFDWLLLSTPLTSSSFSFGHCIVCLSLIDYFWVLRWHLQAFLLVIVLSVFRWLTTSEYSFDIFKFHYPWRKHHVPLDLQITLAF
jgi:multisubunit Na+/H+ antiporter MnhG subunit